MELPAFSLAATVASQQENWVLCMGALQGASLHPPHISCREHPCILPTFLMGNSTKKKCRREEESSTPSLELQLRSRDAPLRGGASPAECATKARAGERLLGSPTFSPASPASRGRGRGSKWPQVRRKSRGLAEPGWHTMPAAPTRPPGPPAAPAGAGPGRAAPRRLPRDLAPSYVCHRACLNSIDGRQAAA